MKKFWILFAFYILALSAIPCTDEIACSETTGTCVSKSGQDPCGDEQQEESCSPFCVCACCGLQGFSSETFPIISDIFSHKKETTGIPYVESFHSLFVAKIWQPPKIA